MTFTLPDLPYAKDALEPYVSAETLDYHHGKHHAAYVNNLNKLTVDTPAAQQSLEAIILTAKGGLFNNAAQVWNHSFYWHCMAPQAGGEPDGELAAAIDRTFGSFAEFKQQFSQAGMTRFGSGWAWLVKNNQNQLSIVSTANADNPITEELTPLLTCDVWEHAYYIDTRNNRGQYIENFWAVVNWNFVTDNFMKTIAAETNAS